MKTKNIKFSPYQAVIIDHQHFDVTQLSKISNFPDDSFSLEVDHIDLESYHFDDECELSIQVKRGRSDVQDEPIGTLANQEAPKKLFDFSESRGLISVRLTVTPKNKAFYCGYSEWRHPNSSVYKSILPVSLEDIGDALWILELPEDDGHEFPKLLMNSTIDGLPEKLKGDFALQSTILPTSIYNILMCMFDQNFSGITDGGSWHYKWHEFASQFNEETIDADASQNQAEDWARKATINFSKNQKYKQLFIKNFMSD